MGWLVGLLLGLVIGGLAWGFGGAVTLGFIGWLAGVIAGSRKSSAPVTPARAPLQDPIAVRLERLESRFASLEARLAKMEGGEAAVISKEVGIQRELDVSPVVEPPAAEPAASVDPGVRGDDEPETGTVPVSGKTGTVPVFEAKPNFLVAWFTGGNTIVRVGAVILFVGLVFLLNYAREHMFVPPELRVAGVAVVGIVLLVLGWRLRHRREGYAVSLQGAGIAVLYLTIFASLRLYHLISPEAAFFLLAAMAVFSALVAVGQDSLALAIIGAGGGFLAPILASTGSGNHVVLFGYYLMLTLGLVVIAWFKAWRSLNVVGFAFTFLIALAWGVDHYRPELFETTEPFLVAFWVVYIAIAILFARTSTSRLVEGTIVFGVPVAAFGLQAGIVKHIEFGLAYSSLIAGAVYLVLATVLMKLQRDRWKMLAECFLGLGVVFATLAIPLALDARWTSAAWALEGAAIVWAGVRQGRTLARAFGILLQLGAGVAYLYGYQRMPAGPPLMDARFVGAVIVSIAGLWTYRQLANAGERVTPPERDTHPALFFWGLAWWLLAGHYEMHTHLPAETRLNAHVAFLAATGLASLYLMRSRGWTHARWPVIGLLPALWACAILAFFWQAHALEDYGWLAWPFAFAVQVYVLRALDARDDITAAALHIGTFLLACALGAWEMHWCAVQVTASGTAWSVASVLLVPAMLLLFAVSKELDGRWPLDRHERAYRVNAALVVLVAMGVWILYANATHDGTSEPLPYLPIVNAIDLGHGLIAVCVAGTLLAWRRRDLSPGPDFTGRPFWVVVGILAFVWLNGVLLRSLHHWADIPYRLGPMTHSLLVQASISIFWAAIALTLMLAATRYARRPLWMTGAVLMGVVVVKLFLVDLSSISGIYRIVSFIGVGVLMLVIGYFSPVPPRATVATREEVTP